MCVSGLVHPQVIKLHPLLTSHTIKCTRLSPSLVERAWLTEHWLAASRPWPQYLSLLYTVVSSTTQANPSLLPYPWSSHLLQPLLRWWSTPVNHYWLLASGLFSCPETQHIKYYHSHTSISSVTVRVCTHTHVAWTVVLLLTLQYKASTRWPVLINCKQTGITRAKRSLCSFLTSQSNDNMNKLTSAWPRLLWEMTTAT